MEILILEDFGGFWCKRKEKIQVCYLMVWWSFLPNVPVSSTYISYYERKFLLES